MDNNVDKYLNQFKEKNYGDSFERMGYWLRSSGVFVKSTRKKAFGSEAFRLLSLNKAKALSIVIFVLLFVLSKYPVNKSQTLGYVMTFSTPQDMVIAANEQLEKMQWTENSSMVVEEVETDKGKEYQYKIIFKEPDENMILQKQKELSSIPEIKHVDYKPIKGEYQIPAYSAALNELFKININAQPLNEKQFESDIKKQLENAGISENMVEIHKLKKGNVPVMVDFPEKVKLNYDSLKNLNKNLKIKIQSEIKQNIKEEMQKVKIDLERIKEQVEKYSAKDKSELDKHLESFGVTFDKQDNKFIIDVKNIPESNKENKRKIIVFTPDPVELKISPEGIEHIPIEIPEIEIELDIEDYKDLENLNYEYKKQFKEENKKRIEELKKMQLDKEKMKDEIKKHKEKNDDEGLLLPESATEKK
ncbi:MAG: hypothetical protein FJ216_03560 [Ignavibacteria bacterium]|nr:hypothetical protein [Ignavibacteria bacterium]